MKWVISLFKHYYFGPANRTGWPKLLYLTLNTQTF